MKKFITITLVTCLTVMLNAELQKNVYEEGVKPETKEECDKNPNKYGCRRF